MRNEGPKRRVLFIGWDAADWEVITPLLEEGLMPSLEGLINRGVMGNLATLEPVLSPMLWTSAATGKFPDKHGIHGFIEPDPINGGARPCTSTSRKCKAVWNILTECGLRSNVVGWWASHPAEPILGNVVTNMFGSVRFNPQHGWEVPPGTIHPKEKAAELGQYRVLPTELTEAHILPFIPDAAQIDQKADRRLSILAKILSDAASFHAVATALMEAEPWDFTAIYYDAIDHLSHTFMPLHGERLAWVSPEDHAIYKDVMRGAYRFHDMMLERLLQLAGPDATVILCSDHGFESGAQRTQILPREPAGPAAAHRNFGVFVMAGPGIKRDERIYGASLIDMAPTVLTLFDLPIGRDMDGRPLSEAFETLPKVRTIESWENTGGEAGLHPGDEELDADQAQELIRQFAALGYIDDPGMDKAKQAEMAKVEGKYNLAQCLLWMERFHSARLLLEEILRIRPWEERFLLPLAICYFREGYMRQAERVIYAAIGTDAGAGPVGLLLLGRIRLARGDLGGAMERFLAAEALELENSVLLTQVGDAFSDLRQWDNAGRAYQKAVETDPENALAWQGLSTVYRHLGKHQETVDAAMHAVSLLHRLPAAHFNLGVALACCGEEERAVIAFETALRFAPQMLAAHRHLALLHAERNPDKARHHREVVERLNRERLAQKGETQERSEKLFDLPEIPPHAERMRILLQERPDNRKPERSGRTFVLVSGLPRSGTSLMMQMLEAGGLPPQTDGERAADIDNPKGYYEWEAIKQIAQKPEILDEEGLEKRAIKCISMLLLKLPAQHDYKVIFMTRPVQEVVLSQAEMINRRATKGARLSEDELERGLALHREETEGWLRGAPHVDSLVVDYPELVRDPAAVVTRLVDFLGVERLPHSAKMASVVDASLYRKRVASASAGGG